MLIAVASRDGKEINQHFGHAERFLIYDVSGTDVKLVGLQRLPLGEIPAPPLAGPGHGHGAQEP